MAKYNTFEACYFGMKGIFDNNPDIELIDNKVIKDLKDIKFSVDSIHLIKVNDSFNCDVLSRDAKGVRRYRVALEKNARFSHLYKILDVKEAKVTSRYQL
jgi:hypothetical protein